MTTRTDRIRQQLERHGYRLLPSEPRVVGGPYIAPPKGLIILSDGQNKPGWPKALTHFLEDASKTGARIQDLINLGPGKTIGPVKIYGTGYFDPTDPDNEDKQWRGYCVYASDKPTPTGDTKTVDASVSQLWRRVFIDPEDTQ